MSCNIDKPCNDCKWCSLVKDLCSKLQDQDKSIAHWRERALDAEAKLRCMISDRDYWQSEHERQKHYPDILPDAPPNRFKEKSKIMKRK